MKKMRLLYFIGLVVTLSHCTLGSQKESENESEIGPAKNIVIINVGVGNRTRISKTLQIVNANRPKVIALDLLFSERKSKYEDSLLSSALLDASNRVMAVTLSEYQPTTEIIYDSVSGTLPEFRAKSKIGFINSITEDDEYNTLKKFVVWENLKGNPFYHFGVQTAMAFDSLKTLAFIEANPRIVEVDFYGPEQSFTVYYENDVIGGRIKKEDIEGKIVLFGYLGPYPNYRGDFDSDKFYTPLNNNPASSRPDMYGVVFLANIINQVLR